jgi:hypothetical protein
MKYATADEKSNPESKIVPMMNGNIARLTLYSNCDFSALSRITLIDEMTRLAIKTPTTAHSLSSTLNILSAYFLSGTEFYDMC